MDVASQEMFPWAKCLDRMDGMDGMGKIDLRVVKSTL